MLNLISLRLKLLKDKKALILIMLGMSIVLTMIFTSSMSGTYRPVVYVIDEDNTVLSESIISKLKSNSTLNYQEADLLYAINNVESGRAIASIAIPEGFEEDLLKKQNPTVNISKSKDSVELYQAISDIRSAYIEINTIDNIVNILVDNYQVEDEALLRGNIFSTGDFYFKHRVPISVSLTTLDINQDWNYVPSLHYLVGFALFFVSFTAVYLVGDILKEKQDGTWQRKLVTPISNFSNVSSLLLVSFITGLAQISLVFIIGRIITRANWGINTGLLLIVFAAFIFCVTSFGLFLSGFIKTYEQLDTIVPIVLIATGMLGGTMWPLEIVQNKALLLLSNLSPHKWAMQSIQRTVVSGYSFEAFFYPVFILIAMGAAFLFIGSKKTSHNR
jgi:ABC-2 type transport system permease protein